MGGCFQDLSFKSSGGRAEVFFHKIKSSYVDIAMRFGLDLFL